MGTETVLNKVVWMLNDEINRSLRRRRIKIAEKKGNIEVQDCVVMFTVRQPSPED